MMLPGNPYAADLGEREPVASLTETAARIAALAGGWTGSAFASSYAPGKWTGAQLLLHLVHVEIFFGTRIRLGLTVPGYVVQPMDQDALMAVEPAVDGAAALQAFVSLRSLNLALFRGLSADALNRPFTHPEYGTITA